MKQSLFLSDDPVSLDDPSDAQSSVNYARWMLFTVVLLTMIGLTMLYSASYGTAGMKYFRNQLIWVALGTAGGVTAYVVGYRKLASKALLWCALCLGMLVVARLFFPAVNGAYRWIRLPGGVSIQPSEFAKLAVALFVAKYCADNFRTFSLLRSRYGILPLGAVTGAMLLGILAGKDLGTTVLVATLAVGTMLAAGLYLRYMIFPLAGAALIGIYVYFCDPTRLSRVTSFTQAEVMRKDEGYQLWNSLLAFGSGGWTGIGFMESRLKASYLPEAHTDFILAVVGEELGLIMMAVIIVLYSAFTFFAFKISVKSNSRLGMLLGLAITLGLSIQAVINIAVVSGAAPTKGMPAPFISYGGSNMIASLISIGILVAIAAETASPGYNELYLNILRRRLSFLPWWRQYRYNEEER